jgi:cellulose synthase/poly-beta-1,6-N-acetylglucosamine synthase-like glycosyltransferase
VITVHNEETLIKGRLDNCFALDYPVDMLEIIVACDGCTDDTIAIVERVADNNPEVKLHIVPDQRGRAFILNEVTEIVKNEIVLFTDANTTFESDYLQKVVSAFNDRTVGCVGGELRYLNREHNSITQNESLYWKVETRIRRLESTLGILTSVSGCNFAIKRELYTPISLSHEIDDIYPYRALKAGYRVVHIDDARVYEDSPETLQHQLYARARIVIQGLPGIISEITHPYFFKHPGYLFSVSSHRILRWLSPFFLILAFISNATLLSEFFYQATFTAQMLLLLSAMIGYLLEKYKRKVSIINSLFAFYIGNLGFLLGMIKLAGKVRMQKY